MPVTSPISRPAVADSKAPGHHRLVSAMLARNTAAETSRTQAFNEWLALLRPLCDAVAEVLWLTRQNGRSRNEIAAGGTFTINFERDTPLQLLRICMPASAGIYPEISGSHHRCSVRFLKWNGLAARASQAEGDIPFQLVTC